MRFHQWARLLQNLRLYKMAATLESELGSRAQELTFLQQLRREFF
jgi:hypothetical protein